MSEDYPSSLPREIEPPHEVESRIAAALRREGLLKRRARAPLAFGIAAAAVIALVMIALHQRPATAQARYILLLYESPQFSGGSRQEYGAWAHRLQPQIIGGEELTSSEVLAIDGSNTRAPRDATRLAGYFLIDARDDAAATRVAQACPHLRHGGAVVLRKIVVPST